MKAFTGLVLSTSSQLRSLREVLHSLAFRHLIREGSPKEVSRAQAHFREAVLKDEGALCSVKRHLRLSVHFGLF